MKPLIGPEPFAALTHYGKLAHNFLGFAFILGVALIFVMWVGHNIPSRHDLTWFMKAGGLFSKGVHPPAHKFNGGQKIIFWATVVGGALAFGQQVRVALPRRRVEMAHHIDVGARGCGRGERGEQQGDEGHAVSFRCAAKPITPRLAIGVQMD